ncbi:MAG: pyridoxal 5'-phosphate synthase lyase subunit PdxS [Candidatus Aenigmarchaeota archaeon]
MEKGTLRLKVGLAEMLKGGVIMDVVNVKQAKIAEKAGAVSVMVLERVPADIRKAGGVARMADPMKIKDVMKEVSIPVMAKVRIGHFAEAQILESIGVDYIDESEVLSPADCEAHIEKFKFKTPFVCGAKSLGEALRRISEGAALIRTKGEPGTGNIIEAVRHMKLVNSELKRMTTLRKHHLRKEAKVMSVPFEVVKLVSKTGKIPVPNFAAGGIATPADASLMMQLGAESVFVGSGIYKSTDPLRRAKAIVDAVTYFDKPDVVAKVSSGLGEAMRGIDISTMDEKDYMQTRSK